MEPHTASRALTEMLLQMKNNELIAHRHATREYCLERKLIPESGFLSFSVIRDPREIIATQIARHLNVQRSAFESSRSLLHEEEIVEKVVRAACRKKRFYYHNDCDYVIKYEHLERDLNTFLTRLGVEDIPPLLKTGVTPHKKHWFLYFNRDQIIRMNRDIPEIAQFREVS
jgi:hypothetical protein